MVIIAVKMGPRHILRVYFYRCVSFMPNVSVCLCMQICGFVLVCVCVIVFGSVCVIIRNKLCLRPLRIIALKINLSDEERV